MEFERQARLVWAGVNEIECWTRRHLFELNRFRRTAIDHSDVVFHKDFLVCLCCGFASLRGIIFGGDGMIYSRQHREQQYCDRHFQALLASEDAEGGPLVWTV